MIQLSCVTTFQLRVAAAFWLGEHPEDPNAKNVRIAIKAAIDAEDRERKRAVSAGLIGADTEKR